MKKTFLARVFTSVLAGAMTLGGVAVTTLAAAPTTAVAATETQTMPDGVTAEVLPLEQADKTTPIQITEPGSYVLKTAEDEMTPIMGYTIDVPNATWYNPVRIYIDGTVYVNRYSNGLIGDRKWLFNIKQGSNIEFIGVNEPSIRFHDKDKYFQAASGFLTDRYYENGYKNATGDISVSLKVGDGSQDHLFLSYDRKLNQKVPAISLGNTAGKLTADFQQLYIPDYVGNSTGWAGNGGIYEYAVPVRLFRANYDNGTNQGNRNPLNATFTDCVFYSTSGDYNGAVSVVGNSNDKDATSNLTATFNNCEFSAHVDEGIWQTNKNYTSVEETKEFAMMNAGGKLAVAGVMGVTNATVNLNNTRIANFHSTRSSSADCTMTVDALNVARSARCNINGGEISRHRARGNTCMVYAAGILTLDGSPKIWSFWKNGYAGSTDGGDHYTESDIATGTAKSLYIPKKNDTNASAPSLNLASGFSSMGGIGDNVVISIEGSEDGSLPVPRVLGTCASSKIKGVIPDGSAENDGNSDKYEIVSLNGELTFRETIHTDIWKVELNGLGVKASCVGPFHNEDCEYGVGKRYLLASYKLSMSSKASSSQTDELVYDGRPVQISMDKYSQQYMSQMGVIAGDVTWYQCKSKEDAEAYQNGTKLDGAPTDAGHYYVTATFKASSGYPNYGATLEAKKAFTISPRRLVRNRAFSFTLKDGGKGAGKYAYTGKEYQPVVESATFTNGSGDVFDLVEGTDYELSRTNEYDLKQTEPGKYQCMVVGKGNFTTDTGTTSVLTLSWEIVDVGRFDVRASDYEGTYDGEGHGIEVAVANAPDDMKIEYRGGYSDSWTEENPQFKNAGTYSVEYRITATDYLTVTGKKTVKIEKADQPAPTGLTAQNWTRCNSNDGAILGATSQMEYRSSSGKAYTKAANDGSISGLRSTGTYYVRYAADYNHNASPDTEVQIAAGPHAVRDGGWKQGEPGWHYKPCRYCGRAVERESCKWVYKIITPATPETDGVRIKVCRACGIEDYYTGQQSYTYEDTYAPVIYDIWEGDTYCESVSFDVLDDRDETVTVTDNGAPLTAGADGRFTVHAAEGDVASEHVIVATDSAGNAETRTIKMNAEHDYEWVVDKAPTPVATGIKHGTCKVCGHESGEVEIPAVGITGYTGVYDGAAHGVTVDAGEVSAIEYRVSCDEEWTTESPVIRNVGSMTVEFKATLTSGEECEGEVLLEVTPRPLTVRASDGSKTYGDGDPALGWEVEQGSLVEGETLEGVEVSREAGEDVLEGGYTVSAGQPEGANANYRIAFRSGTFVIEKRVLGITWEAGGYVYNGREQGPNARLGNVCGNDDVALKVDGGRGVDAGPYTASAVGLTGEAAGNYALPTDGLTCDYEIQKGMQDAPEVQAVAETVSGKKDGSVTGVDSSMEWRADGSDEYTAVGDATEVDGLAAGKYFVRRAATDNLEASAEAEATVAPGRKLAVTLPAEQVGYVLAAQATELSWHDTASFTIDIEPDFFADPEAFCVKVNGNVVEVDGAGTFSVENVEGDLEVTVEGVKRHEAVSDEWLSDEASHWHACACGERIDEAAHDLAWVVDRAPTAAEPGSGHEECGVCGYRLGDVEIPAASVSGWSGVYDGEAHGVDASSLPEGARAEYSLDGGATWSAEAPEMKDAGRLAVRYRVSVGGSVVEGEAALEVSPRPVTVRALDGSKTYGDADPALGWEIAGGSLAEGDSLEGVEVSREAGESVRDGGYAVSAGQPEGANPNYAVAFVPGTFSIERRVVTVAWGTTRFTYDGEAKAPEATIGNVVGDDDLSATVEGSASGAGSHTAAITGLTGSAAGNYALPEDGLTCEFTIARAEQGAPVVQAVAETVSGKKDGSITGVTTQMEWRAQGDQSFSAVAEDGELRGLAAGAYEVRYKAGPNHDASPVTTVEVAEGRKLVVSLPASQVGYSVSAEPAELGWRGSAKLSFALADGYFKSQEFAVRVNGQKVELADDGTYELRDLEDDALVTVEGVKRHEPDGTGWKSDAASHWHVCACGERIDEAAHDFEWETVTAATTSSKGSRRQVCKVCGAEGAAEETPMLAPAIVEGAGQKAVLGEGASLKFRSNAPYELFCAVKVDGNELDRGRYELSEGSTVVVLKAEYLATLSAGEHTLDVVSQSGTASTTFTVAQKSAPVDPVPSDPSTPTAPSTPTTPGTPAAPTDAAKDAASAGQQPVADTKKAALPASGDESAEPGFLAACALLGAALVAACAIARRRNA